MPSPTSAYCVHLLTPFPYNRTKLTGTSSYYISGPLLPNNGFHHFSAYSKNLYNKCHFIIKRQVS